MANPNQEIQYTQVGLISFVILFKCSHKYQVENFSKHNVQKIFTEKFFCAS